MYHRFVRSKKPDSHSAQENEKEDSRVNLGLPAYTRSRPTMEDIMLYQAHHLTPISSALLSKAGPVKSNEIMVDDMVDLDQSSSPGLSQYCGIDFDNISPPAGISFDELDEEFFASLAIPKVLVPPTEPGQEQQQAMNVSPPPSHSNLVFDIPSSENLVGNQTNCQENITEDEPTNNSTQTPKQHKKHKKDGRKKKEKKEKKKKVEQETQEVKEMEETKTTMETEEVKEKEGAKEAKELKKKKRKKKKKEESKNKCQKDSTDYTTSCDSTKHDFPIFSRGTITIDRNPYPVWSNKYSLYSTNMCSASNKADTSQTPASAITSTAADKSPAQLLWQKSVDNKTAVSPKLPDPSSSDEFEAVHYQYNDITNVLTPTLESSTSPQKERGNLIKEVAQEVRSYFHHPTVASTAGIETKKSYHQLTRPQSTTPQQQQKRDIQSIINKYCQPNQDSKVYCPKAPISPKETNQDSSTLVNNTNTPVRKFGRIIHCNPTVNIASTHKPTPPNNTTNPHPPTSCLTSSNALHQSPSKGENSPARQPHPPPSKPQPSAASQCPSTSGPRPPTASQRPPTSRPRPPTAKQGPINFMPHPPTAGQCPSTSRPRPPTASQRPPTSRPRPPTAHQCPPTSKQRPPTAKPQPQSSSHRPPAAKMVLLQSQKSDYHLIDDESAPLPQLSPSQTEPEEPLTNFSLKPNPPSMPQQLDREFYRAKIARRLKKIKLVGRALESRGHKL